MKTYELIEQIKGLEYYVKVMKLDEYTKACMERTISELKDTLQEMLGQGLFKIEDI